MSNPEYDIAHLQQWLGRSISTTADLTPAQANLMNATLDRPPTLTAGDPLPPAWHWLYFHEPIPASAIGPDGHAELGDFMPPVPLPRRMWAGGKLNFHEPLVLGEAAAKQSTVTAIEPKTGRSGALFFVTLTHELTQNGTLCLSEEQTLVYREPSQPEAPPAAPKPAADLSTPHFSASYTPTPILLFRYSALTFNSHRIHYDVDFCRTIEGYPDLVIHGPLIATLILDLFWRNFNHTYPKTFAYRAQTPLFHPHPFTVNGLRHSTNGRGWATDHNGRLAMNATLHF